MHLLVNYFGALFGAPVGALVGKLVGAIVGELVGALVGAMLFVGTRATACRAIVVCTSWRLVR